MEPPSWLHGRGALLLWALLVSAAAVSLLAMRPVGDLVAVVPSDGPLGQQAAFFEHQAGAQILALELYGDPLQGEQFLRHHEDVLARHGARPLVLGSADDQARIANIIHDHLPLLLLDEDYATISAALASEALEQRLAGLARWLRRPGNEVAAAAALRDILGLGDGPRQAIEALASAAPAGSSRLGPWLLHADGEHLLALYQVDFPPGSSARAQQLVAACHNLSEQAAAQGLSLRSVGSYRHFVDNDRAVISDMLLTIPLSLLAIILILWSALRSWRVIALLHLPAIAALLGGLAAVTWWYQGAVPLMALAFAPALIGISVDYGIHMAGACRDGAWSRVRQPLVIGGCTASAAFLALLASRFPLLAGLGIMVAAGLGLALLTTLIILPRAIPARSQASPWPRLSGAAYDLGHRRPWRNLFIVLLICLATIPGISRLSLGSDLGALDASAPATQADLEAVSQRWGRLGGSDFLVVDGADWPAIEGTLHSHHELRAVSAPLRRLFPSAAEQDQRRERWNAFWHNQHTTFSERLASVAQSQGLRASALEASRQRYRPITTADQPAISPATWADTALALTHQQRLQPADHGLRLSLALAIPDQAALAHWQGIAEQQQTVMVASRRLLAQALVDELQADMSWLFALMTVVMVIVVCLGLRSLRHGLAVALVPILGVLWAFGILGWLGLALTPMHLLITGFACGIGIDDGVFYRRRADRRHSLPPMLATTITSCAALTALLMGQHPAIRDVALAVLLTLLACLLACLLVIPALVQRDDQQPAEAT